MKLLAESRSIEPCKADTREIRSEWVIGYVRERKRYSERVGRGGGKSIGIIKFYPYIRTRLNVSAEIRVRLVTFSDENMPYIGILTCIYRRVIVCDITRNPLLTNIYRKSHIFRHANMNERFAMFTVITGVFHRTSKSAYEHLSWPWESSRIR